jgi:ATP-binding cassette subfamily B protein
VALVGENGAGKTTLVKLLCRFYDASDGVIAIDGIDIRRLPLEEWRARIAAGFQDFVRFELLARQAVGVGEVSLVDDETAVLSALDRAHARDFVERLDAGLDTPLGKGRHGGTELSGGQWQKVALGRAMMRDAPLLLILDEPTAALDAETEHQLFDRYAKNARRLSRQTGAITILVSHRFSTVRTADLILVIKDGHIEEAGSHADLIKQNGVYAELYGLQASAYR